MRDRQRTARETRNRFRRAAERESREILAALGLSGHPLARRIARRLTDTESEIGRLRNFIDTRGRLDRAGNPRPAFTEYNRAQERDRAELRQLLDRLSEVAGGAAGSEQEARSKIERLAAEYPGALTYRAVFSEGAETSAGEPLAAPERREEPEPRVIPQPRAPALREPAQRSTAPPAPEARPALSPVQRRWILGEDL
jgi:hypothetical protein